MRRPPYVGAPRSLGKAHLSFKKLPVMIFPVAILRRLLLPVLVCGGLSAFALTGEFNEIMALAAV